LRGSGFRGYRISEIRDFRVRGFGFRVSEFQGLGPAGGDSVEQPPLPVTWSSTRHMGCETQFEELGVRTEAVFRRCGGRAPPPDLGSRVKDLRLRVWGLEVNG